MKLLRTKAGYPNGFTEKKDKAFSRSVRPSKTWNDGPQKFYLIHERAYFICQISNKLRG